MVSHSEGAQTSQPTSEEKEESHKDAAHKSAGSTWDNIKAAASSAQDQAANKIDKNTAEAKAKVSKAR